MRCWRAVREMIRFEILWKLLFFLLINPVFRDVYQTYVASVGLSFNGGMLWTFLTPKVALIFLALLLGAGCLYFMSTAWRSGSPPCAAGGRRLRWPR